MRGRKEGCDGKVMIGDERLGDVEVLGRGRKGVWEVLVGVGGR